MLTKLDVTKKALRSTVHKVQLIENAFLLQVTSIITNKMRRGEGVYKPSFSDEDMVGVEDPYNDTLVLTVNIINWNVIMVFVISAGSSRSCTRIYIINTNFQKQKYKLLICQFSVLVVG